MADKDYTFGLAINARAPDNRFDYRLSARAKAVIHLETGESVQYIDRQQVRACPVRDLSASGLRLWSACSFRQKINGLPRRRRKKKWLGSNGCGRLKNKFSG